MSHQLPEPASGHAPAASRARPRWRLAALAAATLGLGLTALDAHALALGRLTVLSALGEPLRAEIDLPQVSPEELATLNTTLGSNEAFRAAGMERSNVLNDLRITVQQRPAGGYVMRLASDRPVNEPFVDLLIEASWSAGRIVRDYTMLFDPPALRQAAPPPPQAAQVTPPPAAAPAAPAAAAAPPSTGSTPMAPPAPAPAAARAEAAPARPAATPAAGRKVTVASGDTAARLAAANKPPAVSLDQMLVAMLRANPQAFIDGNVNRLKAGAVVDLPGSEQAAAVDPAEARRALVAQSRDFNEFRRRMAEATAVEAPERATPGRQASGQIQAQVVEKKPVEPTPDKLLLSKGAVQGRSAQEDRIAQERSAREASTRVAELERNIADLNRLGVASGSAATPPAATPVAAAASGAGVPVTALPASAPASAASAATPPAEAASQAASMPAPVASAPASAPAARPASAKRAAEQPADAGLLGVLQESPLLPVAAGGALAALLGLLLWRRRKANGSQVDSSFLESQGKQDSFFGASGGQRVDTAENGPMTANSMVYSPSQIDAAGDVDPVAEADVYLAYGRDLQAEEILKEALRINPQRVAILAKLLEIYARRGDARAFEPLAVDARALTRGTGPEWNQIATLGRELLPGHPLFQGVPESVPAPAPAAPPVQEPEPEPEHEPSAGPSTLAPLDIDLDAIDLDLPEPTATTAADMPARTVELPDRAAPTAPAAPAAQAGAADDLDLDLAAFRLPDPPEAHEAKPGSGPIDFEHDLDLSSPPPKAAQAPAPASEPPSAGNNLMDFNLADISLDLDTPSKLPEPATPADESDPLSTKLALAEEFRAIGDMDGARSLAQEVRDEAEGDLRQRAERLLADLG